jgi:hypothetical protein
MPSPLEQFTKLVAKKLRYLGYLSPTARILGLLVNTAYLATLRTEEGKFVLGSLIFADPRHPDSDRPFLRRANYPSFTPFDSPVRLTVEKLVKLSRAVDGWSGSIAVYGTPRSSIVAWGVLDQLVQHNVSLRGEKEGGFHPPGILRLAMDGIGALSAYQGDLFLGGVRQDQVVHSEQVVLYSTGLAKRLHSILSPIAQKISMALGSSIPSSENEQELFNEWSKTIARICIGIRRAGTGGALLISPHPNTRILEVGHRIPYSRLGHAAILHVLDSQYSRLCYKAYSDSREKNDVVSIKMVSEQDCAETDQEDRESELSAAIRMVTSFASLDGIVLLTPLLEVVGFGVKVLSSPSASRVYVADDYVRRGSKAKCIDISQFGMRHISMLNYCLADRKAIGIVVSQDGQVRLMFSEGKSLLLWENVQLLRYGSNVRSYAKMIRRNQTQKRAAHFKRVLGYTDMPKTFSRLMGLKSKKTMSIKTPSTRIIS